MRRQSLVLLGMITCAVLAFATPRLVRPELEPQFLAAFLFAFVALATYLRLR